MSPRPYTLGRRQVAIDLTRARILQAVRQVLGDTGDVPSFSIENVAKQAGVARMTVYYHFESKWRLLEAVSDELTARGLVGPLQAAFRREDPTDALDAFVAAFCGFWASDRVIIRRIRALAALEAEIHESVRGRDARRRQGVRVIVARISRRYGRPATHAFDELADVIHTLTSFETFDALADMDRGAEGACDVIQRLVRVAVASLR